MSITDKNIDNGKEFDWGRVSSEYAKFRDIYPKEFYEKIIKRELCIDGQCILDVGTGTGVIPRNMYRYGAKWIGTDISENQIKQAQLLSKDMDIKYFAVPTEKLSFSDSTFDVITACQCFWYFDHNVTSELFYRFLKPNGSLLVLYMAWLPFEDKIASKSEELVLKYNPDWSGGGFEKFRYSYPDWAEGRFAIETIHSYDTTLEFSRSAWLGRVRSCRGVGARLSEDRLKEFEAKYGETLKKCKEPLCLKHQIHIEIYRSEKK